MILYPDRILIGDSMIAPKGAAVFVNHGKIAAVDNINALVRQYPQELVQHMPGQTLLPGLIDAHTHIGFDGQSKVAQFDDYLWALYACSRLYQALQSGITTIRDVSSRNGLALSLKKAANWGFTPDIPHILTCNNGIAMTGGHGVDAYQQVVECDGEWEIRKAVRTQVKKGADWVKVLTSEGWRGQELTQEELNAAVDESHRLCRPVAIHAGYIPSIEMSIAAGCDTIEHGTYLTVEQAQVMKNRGISWIPTLYVCFTAAKLIRKGISHFSPDVQDYLLCAEKVYLENFRTLYDVGLNVACGTDMEFEGESPCPVADEAACMVQCGLTPLQAIEAATKNGAAALGLTEVTGQIKVGLSADLLAVYGEPDVDISCLKNVSAVFLAGRPVFMRNKKHDCFT